MFGKIDGQPIGGCNFVHHRIGGALRGALGGGGIGGAIGGFLGGGGSDQRGAGLGGSDPGTTGQCAPGSRAPSCHPARMPCGGHHGE